MTKDDVLKLALSALQDDAYMYNGENTWAAITAVKKALSLPKQEPVAWAISYDGETPHTLWRGDQATLDIEIKRLGETACKLPLYTAPPDREWVGLTDTEAQQIIGKAFREVEAKLKEKNVGF